MSNATKSRVVARSTGHRCPVEGWWRRYVDLETAAAARPRRSQDKDVYFAKGATFPPDAATRRRCGWRLVAAA